MSRPRPWPDNAKHARDKTAKHSAEIILDMRKLIRTCNQPEVILVYSRTLDRAWRIYTHMIEQGASKYLADEIDL